MPAPTRLLLVRHALTSQTGPILSGRLPGIALSEEGRAQAKALAERLADLPVAAVYSSPLERTLQTAVILAEPHGLEVETLEGLQEVDFGSWSGRRMEELAQTDLWGVIQRAPSRARFPEGESVTEMQARAVAVLGDLVEHHRGELVVAVSHADVIKAVAAHFLGLALDLFQRLVVAPASMTALAFGADRVTLLKLNDTGGMEELRPHGNAPEDDDG